METRPAKHPTAEILKAFGLGKLDDSSSGELMAHLDPCADCRKIVASQSGDDFLDRFRQARSRNATPAPPKSLGGVEGRPKPPPVPTTLFNLPPELADNPQYDILKELGRGGMGVVYLAKNKLMDRLEVLKVINKALLDRPGAVERFLREIRAAAKLNHVNVVVAYSALQLGDLLVFAMEYVEGQDLADVVKANGPLPVAHACFYVQQAAQGLQHALEKKMVHRDIKPQNLILARESRKHLVKILDFGLAKVLQEKTEDTGLTGEGKMLGTPDYMAPEQTLDATSADIRADIYSLGCTLYFLLSGSRPFKGKNLFEIMQAHQSLEATALNVARPEVPAELAAVVRKMMAKERAQRYQTPLDVVQALSPFVKQVPQKPSSQSSSGLSVDAPAAACVKPTPQQRESPAGRDARTKSVLPSATPSRSKPVRKKRRSPTVQTSARKKWLIGVGVGAMVLLLALLGMWAGGVFKVKTKHGTIVLENLPADAVVEVDGDTVKLNAGDGKPVTISVTADRKHRLQVRKEGFKVFGQDVEIDGGGKLPITVRLEPQPGKPDPQVKEGADDKNVASFFNGKDLTGWEGLPGYWRVEGGAIVGSMTTDPGFNTFLCSQKSYSDFELKCRVRLKGGIGNSGVQIRSKLENDKKFIVAGPQCDMGADYWGSLYGEQFGGLMKQSPGDLVKKAVKPADFNDYYIKCVGKHVTIKINDRTMVDGDFPAMPEKGIIAWQLHTGFPSMEVAFKDIQFTDLSKPRADGFVPLFNGKDLTGWKVDRGAADQWTVEGNTIRAQSKNYTTRNYLLTEKEYADFVLRFEFKVEEGSHGGVGIRAVEGERLPIQGQLIFDHPLIKLTNPKLDRDEPTGTTHWLKSAATYVFPRELLPVPAGTWHSMEVVVRGDNCTATIDGKKLINETLEADAKTNGDFIPGLARRKGKVGFQINTGTLRFRAIEIKELP